MRLGRKLAVGVVVEESRAEEVAPVEEPRDTVETPEPERPAPVTADR
ncbi:MULTISPECIES: hypothetical protein [Amycolatopsis]|uniref:Uncharacterized protein n=1 Tax=Amycolatopsis viridis TaxID=185678 RepID=A0ABX0T0T9_9PSEU|nr:MULTISPECIES: hypothetical protein [Amycolatopsis]NIH81509.1 hypothetical protein [Amycolatopsis viridis]NIH84535.1 hypothetical protein [Amycolatopsis granulosa]